MEYVSELTRESGYDLQNLYEDKDHGYNENHVVDE